MRALWALFLGVLMSLVLVTGVASAAPGQSFRDSGTGKVTDQCTGEVFDDTFNIHVVATASGPFHFNVHIEGIGEKSGSRYVGNNVDNEFAHANPDGTFTVDQVLSVHVVSQGNLPNSLFTIHTHLVVDSDNNVISGRTDSSFACQGS
jgi:hypothetical protein